MCLDRSAEGLRPVPKALSDPEIKSLTKNERKTHTAAASVNERSEGSRGEREKCGLCTKEREKRGGGRASLALDRDGERLSVSWETTESALGVRW